MLVVELKHCTITTNSFKIDFAKLGVFNIQTLNDQIDTASIPESPFPMLLHWIETKTCLGLNPMIIAFRDSDYCA